MRRIDDTIAWIAGAQHGRITHEQLRACGLSRDQIKSYRERGILRLVHVGVYAVGHEAPSVHADLMAAVLACGSGAAASHRSAAQALGIVPVRPPLPEVTVPTTAGAERKNVRIHRVSDLDPAT